MDDINYLINQHLKSKNIFDENFPWIAAKSKISGRGLFATRDIQPGEIIFKDNPLIVGPRASKASPLICVSCYGRENLRACSRGCGLPVCSETCENSTVHRNECQIITRWKNGHDFSDMQLSLFKCLTPLRSLLLNDEQKTLLKLLKAHSGPPHGYEVDILKEKLMLSFDEEEESLMRLTCYALDANSFEVTVGKDVEQASLRGLYPLSSLMNHKCVPNSMHVFDCNQNMIVKASVLIPEGEEIFDSYTRLYWGTCVRRPHLVNSKNFYCVCSRCEDPSEFGTNLSAINCFNCRGLVLPYFVRRTRMTWKCTSCNEEMPSDKAGMIISTFSASLTSFKSSDTEAEDVINFLNGKLSKYLPLCSQIAVELKYKLVWILGYHRKYLWKDLSEELLNEKESICRELLELLEKLGAGKNKMRGLVLYELCCCLREKQRRLKSEELNIVNEDVLVEQTRETELLFEESRDILTDDVHAPPEIRFYNKTQKNKSAENEELIVAG